MRVGYRSPLCHGLLLATLAASVPASAVEVDESNQDLRPLVSEARELIGEARQQVSNLDARLSRTVAAAGGSGDFSGSSARPGNSSEYAELRRSLTRLGEIGNEVLDRASACGAESRKIAADFRTRTRKASSSLSRVASSSMDFARMALTNVERDLDAIEQQLQAVATLHGCKQGGGADDEGAGETG
jgi:hypothetical protein